MNIRYLSVLAVASILSSSALADEYRGRSIGSSCMGCHGTGSAIPKIILGSPVEYYESVLKSFRDGSRPGTIMGRIAKGYSDEDIAAVAQYFSTMGEK